MFFKKIQPFNCDTGRNKKSASQLCIEETELCVKNHFFKNLRNHVVRPSRHRRKKQRSGRLEIDHCPRPTRPMRLGSLYDQKLVTPFMTKGNVTNTSQM